MHHHNTRFTIISINFRKYGNEQIKKLDEGKAVVVDAHYSKSTFVILDKKQTLKIRAVKIIRPITVMNNDTIRLMRFDIPLSRIFENIDEKYENKGVLKEFQYLDFRKLDVY